jgi:hypothetical protein
VWLVLGVALPQLVSANNTDTDIQVNDVTMIPMMMMLFGMIP